MMKRVTMVLSLLSACLLMAASAQAGLLASTSFENENGTSGSANVYEDENFVYADHDLENHSDTDRLLVDSTSDSEDAGDLGYDATFKYTRSGNANLVEGVYCGVTVYTHSTYMPNYTDGTQGYEIMAAGGEFVLTFDEVDISGSEAVQCNVDIFVSSSDYETDDVITVKVILDGSTDPNDHLVLLDTTGQSIEDLDLELNWTSFVSAIGDIPDSASTAQLVITCDTEDSYEGIYIDNVSFVDDTQSASYDWEDGYGTVLTVYGDNIDSIQNGSDPNDASNNVLEATIYPIEEDATTARLYLGYVKGLEDGDMVTVSLKTYDEDNSDYQKVNLGAAYAYSNDLSSYEGSVGYGSYSSGTGWNTIRYSTTFNSEDSYDGDADAVLLYAYLSTEWSNTDPQIYYLDDIEVTAPGSAEIILPPLYNPADYTTTQYGWENFSETDREVVLLGTYGALFAGLETTEVSEGTKALNITHAGGSTTPQGYVAWVNGLEHGDVVDASLVAKKFAGQDGDYTGTRLWAHYTYDENDRDSYAGSAYGATDYPGDDWTELEHLWLFDATSYDDDGTMRTPTGLMIEVRTYLEEGEGGYVDDINLMVPSDATVTFPDPTGPAICVGGLPALDLDNDCKVDLNDFVILAGAWMQCNLQPSEDCGL